MSTESHPPTPSGFFDRLGIILSSLCMLHCLAMPLVTTYVSVAGMEFFAEDLAHRVLLVLLAGTGLSAFIPGLRRHRDWTVGLLAALGFGLVAFGAFGVHELLGHEFELLVNLLGSAGLIGAHILNFRRNNECHNKERCHHDHASHETRPLLQQQLG